MYMERYIHIYRSILYTHARTHTHTHTHTHTRMHTHASYTGAGRAAECDIRPGGEPPARPEGPPHTPRQRLRLQNLSRSSLLAGHWSLVIGPWSLVTGHWSAALQNLSRSSLLAGHWSLVIGHWSLVIGHWSLVIGHWSLVTGHWSLVTGHWSLVIGHWSLVSSSLLVARHRLDGPARTPRHRLWLQFLSRVTIFVTGDYR